MVWPVLFGASIQSALLRGSASTSPVTPGASVKRAPVRTLMATSPASSLVTTTVPSPNARATASRAEPGTGAGGRSDVPCTASAARVRSASALTRAVSPLARIRRRPYDTRAI